MIFVDSSVWIANLRNIDSVPVRTLRAENPRNIVVGDLVLLEVLMGTRDDLHAARIERDLRQLGIHNMLNASLAVATARNYRRLRTLGVTVRKPIDLIIGTYCIEHGHALLHQDRDFDPMARHLGLVVA